MAQFKKTVELIVSGLLKKAGVPDSQLQDKLRKIGRGMLLVSILMIVPLLMFNNIPLVFTITLQMVYATLMCIGVILSFDDETNNGKP
jgi:hypothetical protein